MRRPILTFIATVLSVPAAAASRAMISSDFTKVYQNQIIAQRVFCSGGVVKYSKDGHSTQCESIGSWTLYADISCQKVTLKHKKLVIRGKHVWFEWDNKQERLRPYFGPLVEIDIALGNGAPTLATLQAEIAKVFLTTGENSELLVPDYWKPFLSNPKKEIDTLRKVEALRKLRPLPAFKISALISKAMRSPGALKPSER